MWNHQLWMAIADPPWLKLRFVGYVWLSHLRPPVVLIVGCDGWRHYEWNLHMHQYHVSMGLFWLFVNAYTAGWKIHSTSLVSGSCSCQWSFPFECYCGDIETIILRPVQNLLVETWVNELYYKIHIYMYIYMCVCTYHTYIYIYITILHIEPH